MSNIAIITARGASRRVPRENIRPFLGKPVITYSIQAAQIAGLFSDVMVSTDDAEIADIARQCGATVPFLRSAETAGDFATTADVLREVFDQYQRQGQVFDYACCLYPTAPFVTPNLLRQAFSTLTNYKFDTVYPLQRFGFPIQRAVSLHNQRVEWLQPEHALTRSQDLEPAYHDAGQFYFFNVATFQRNHRLITDNSGGVVISEMAAHDIDTENDWRMAELKFKLMNGQ
jgi:N-acylneuraminate cytidylyltransferase